MSRFLDMVDNPSHVKKSDAGATHATGGGNPAGTDHQTRRQWRASRAESGRGRVDHRLHRVFTTPHDKFVWDVSHQVYVHKLLTGRKDRFHTIRTTNGLNGFALRTESEHDCYGAGHAGTALSAALGMCAARDQRKSDENVVCIFGDAALTNGISFEALNNIAHTTKRFIGILNDNEWSIAKNVGAIAGYLNKLITHPRYNKLHKDFERFAEASFPKGEIALKLGTKRKKAQGRASRRSALEHEPASMDADGRGGFGSSLIFEEMGLRYLGPIDGHDLPLLIRRWNSPRLVKSRSSCTCSRKRAKGTKPRSSIRRNFTARVLMTSRPATRQPPSQARRPIIRTCLARRW